MNKKKILKKVCNKYGIAFAYLFGSQALRGVLFLEGEGEGERIDDPLTDIDLGLVFINGLPDSASRSEVYANLHNDLGYLFLPLPLDLTFLEENHSVFQANAITQICVYSYNEKRREQYQENILRRAADFKPFLEKYLDEYLEEVISK